MAIGFIRMQSGRIKKKYSSKIMLFLTIIGMVLTGASAIATASQLTFALIDTNASHIVVYAILSLCFLAFFVFFFLAGNRYAHKIIFDPKINTVARQGLFFGYRYMVRVEDIKEVIVVDFPFEGEYYVLVDSVNQKYDGGSKKSFIRIEKRQENDEFLKQFWDKPIEHREYDELFS